MNYEEFVESLSTGTPPAGLNEFLLALWYEGKGDWRSAHDIVEDMHDKNAAWIHAYLHRKEGDIFNARYWYNRAGQSESRISLQEEWTFLVKEFI